MLEPLKAERLEANLEPVRRGLVLYTFGTPHADYFHGPVPCTRELTDE